MRSDSLNKLEDSQLNDSKLNESSASRAKKKKTLKDYEFVINENSKYKTSELGKGAYGTVKKVKDLETGKIFAMKIMNKKAIFEYSNKENLKREISIQRKMHHPHIVRLYTCFEDSENVYLVLEFAENGSLFQYLRKKKTLEENEAFIFFFQTCLGIYYLHRKNVIHRDLKPENLLLDGEGNIKLCDFGWSADNYSKRVTFCGTVDYLAPEMIKNHPHDHRVDIWCLGILLYEMLHGKAPFKGRSDQEKTKNISMNSPIHFDPSLSPEVVDLIQRILKPSPIERISMLEIFNHPWMKRHEAVFKIDIKGYIEEQGGQSIQDVSVSQSLNDSFGMNTTVEKPNGSSAPSKAKIITIQDTTPLNLPGSTTAIDEKKVRSESNRDFEKKHEKSRSEAVGSVNIDQFLKDYKIDSTPEMDLLNKVEKFANGGKPSYEPEKAQSFTTDNRSISMPVGNYAGLSKSSSDLSYLNQGSGYGYTAAKIEQKPLTGDYNPYAHQEGESLDQFLRRIRSLGTDPSGTGTSYSTNPFGSGTTGERFSQNTPGMPSYKTETASFGKRSTNPEGYNDDYDMEPQRMSRLSKRNVEIGGLRPSSVNKPKPELNFMEKILVGLGCMTRENPRDNPSKVPRK